MFDFDGVLGDTEPLHYRAWKATLEPRGYSISWEFYQANCIGVADDALFPKIFPETDVGSLVAEKRKRYRASLEETPPFLPATVDFIREAARKFPLAVVSSSARVEVATPLAQAGIADCFQLIVTREDVQRIKPDPEPYRTAAQRMSASNPLVIEDSVSGIAAGRAAGFTVVEVSSPHAMPSEVRAAWD